MKQTLSLIFLVFCFLAVSDFVNAAESEVPEPFKRFDPFSTKKINYDVLTQWLDYLVVDIGRSNRNSAQSGRGQIAPPLGTRLTVVVPLWVLQVARYRQHI